MKKATIARFVMGMAAIFAAGCSAEQGSGEPAVGATSEALHGTGPAVTATVTNSLATGFKLAASCRILDTGAAPNVEYIVAAGGLLSTGAATDQVIVRPATSATNWTVLTPKLQSARLYLSAVQDPNDVKACYVAGGEDTAGNASKHVEKISVNNGVWSVTAKTDMNVARSRFALYTCGSGLIAFAGRDANLGTPEIRSIEASASLGGAFTTYNSSLPVAGGATGNELIDRVYDFGSAKDPTADRYLIAGGYDGTNELDHIEQVTTSVSSGLCTPVVAALTQTGASKIVISNAVIGNVAFSEDGSATKFIVTAGAKANGTTPTNMDLVTVNWGTPGSTTVAANGTTLSQGVYHPTLVGPITDPAHPADKPAFTLVSGGTFSAAIAPPLVDATAAVTDVQTYQSSFGLNAAATKLTNARFANVSALLTTSGAPIIYTAAGEKYGPATYVLTMESITP